MKNREILRFFLGPKYTHCHVACFKKRHAAVYPWWNMILKNFHYNFKSNQCFLASKNFTFATLCQMFLPLSLTSDSTFYFRWFIYFFPKTTGRWILCSPDARCCHVPSSRGAFFYSCSVFLKVQLTAPWISSTPKQILGPHPRLDMSDWGRRGST